jgi:hypothetical protein
VAGALLAGPVLAREPLAETFRPVALAGAAYGVALLVVAGLIVARRIAAAVALNTVGLLAVVLVAARNVPPAMALAFTDADVPGLVARHGLAGQAIVASPVSARGVPWASGSPVVVLAGTKRPFWSDHPVEVIASDAEIASFFAARDTVLCVIRPADVARLSRLLGPSRTLEVLSSVHRRTVVLSRRR